MRLVTLFLLLIAVSGQSRSASETNLNIPKIRLSYSSIFDDRCDWKKEVTEEHRSELDKLMPQFNKAWNESGPLLLKTTTRILKRPFPNKDAKATVFLCSWFPSMSHPLIIKPRKFMKSFMEKEGEKVKPMENFVGLVFHEVLHNYIVDNYKGKTKNFPTMKKYESEDDSVKAHIYLMALQKKVYLDLGMHDTLAKVIEYEREVGKVYQRSWDIVEKEGYEKLVGEML